MSFIDEERAFKTPVFVVLFAVFTVLENYLEVVVKLDLAELQQKYRKIHTDDQSLKDKKSRTSFPAVFL